MEEEITTTKMPDQTITDDLPISEDVTNFVGTDDSTLMGTVLQYVFGNVDVMVFIVSMMVLVTLLIISTDYMRWKGRD